MVTPRTNCAASIGLISSAMSPCNIRHRLDGNISCMAPPVWVYLLLDWWVDHGSSDSLVALARFRIGASFLRVLRLTARAARKTPPMSSPKWLRQLHHEEITS
jgi:hypothetical protein